MKRWISILFGGILLTGPTAWAADPVGPAHDTFPVSSGVSAPMRLAGSNPQRYATAYQRALAYLTAHVSARGLVTRQTGSPAGANTSAYVAVALAENGQVTAARAIVNRLALKQTSQGGWNQALNPRDPATLGATAHVLWAEASIAEYLPGADGGVLRPSIERGANRLVTWSSPVWGTFMQTPTAVGSAEENAVAVTALERASQVAGTEAERRAWRLDMVRARAGLINDNGVSRTTTTDFLAVPLWNLEKKPVALRRDVASLFELGFAYQGYGAKAGPGYYTWMDWENGVSTFNDVMASANAGLPDVAEMQYNYGLTLQNADGGFGAMAHAPVGPETGAFHRPPTTSSVPVTAHYLLASQSLLRHHMIGFGWHAATISTQGHTKHLEAPAVARLDPRIPMKRGIRVAVLVSDPNTVISSSKPPTVVSNEAGLELNAAWQLTQMGYNVSLFWYKPNHAENFYPRADLWANLKSFQVLVMSNNGFSDQNGYQAAFRKHVGQLQSWLAHGGRFLDLGDQGSAPLPTKFSVSVKPSRIHRVIWANANLSVVWQNAAGGYYRSLPSGYQTLAVGGRAVGAMKPVAVGAHDGKGRIVLTTLSTANHAQDHMPFTKALWTWAIRSIPSNSQAAPMESYAQAARNLMGAMQRNYLASGTHLYIELSYPREHLPPPTGPQLQYAYLWPFTQAMAGLVESTSVLDKAQARMALKSANQGLAQYYDAYLSPPGYESYVASAGGGTAYFDDNGWTDLDLLHAYRDTGNPLFLKEAKVDTKFLESGWNRTNSPQGGEYFNENSQTRTQTATGSFLDAVLRLYLATRNPKDLNWARSISAWDRKYMRGLNGIYSDSMSPDGVVAGPPFTYDAGVVLQADVLLYRATGKALYLKRAEQLGVAAISAFVDPLNGVLIENAGTSNAPFNAILLRGLNMLWRVDPSPLWLSPLKRQAAMAIRYDRFPNGVYGSNWTGMNNPQTGVDLLTQGGTLRLFGMLADVQQPRNPTNRGAGPKGRFSIHNREE